MNIKRTNVICKIRNSLTKKHILRFVKTTTLIDRRGADENLLLSLSACRIY
jgi:hypothetical protein